MKVVNYYQTAVLIFSILFLCLTPQNYQKPIVVGYFYPADSTELKSMLKKFYDHVPEHRINGKIYALISPHAGYIYSGQVAAYGYTAIKNQKYDCIILIGPSHHYGQGGVAIDQRDGHQTPLGTVSFDKPLAQKFLNRKGILSAATLFTDHPCFKKLKNCRNRHAQSGFGNCPSIGSDNSR